MKTRRHFPRIIIAVLAVVTLVIGLATAALAQGAIETTLTAAPAEATVGDPVSLTLSVTHPTGYFVIAPQLDAQWGDFTVAGQSAATTTANGDGTETTTVVYDARLFAPGAYSTPPLTYTVTDGAGNLFEFTAQPVSVNVASVLTDGDTELRDIKPQAELPTATWLYLLGGGLALAALAGGLVWLARRRRPAVATADTRTPYERALDDLAGAERLNLPAEGRFNEHYTLVSESVRRYMGLTYHIPVLERTTAEIQHDLQTAAIDPTLRRRFVSFLQDSDVVKFANFRPTMADAAAHLAEARAIVETAQATAAPLVPSANGRGEDGGPLPPDAPRVSANGEDKPEEVRA